MKNKKLKIFVSYKDIEIEKITNIRLLDFTKLKTINELFYNIKSLKGKS